MEEFEILLDEAQFSGSFYFDIPVIVTYIIEPAEQETLINPGCGEVADVQKVELFSGQNILKHINDSTYQYLCNKAQEHLQGELKPLDLEVAKAI